VVGAWFLRTSAEAGLAWAGLHFAELDLNIHTTADLNSRSAPLLLLRLWTGAEAEAEAEAEA